MGFSVRWRVESGLSIEYSGIGWQNGVWHRSTSKPWGRNDTSDRRLFRCVDDALSAFWCIEAAKLVPPTPTIFEGKICHTHESLAVAQTPAA